MAGYGAYADAPAAGNGGGGGPTLGVERHEAGSRQLAADIAAQAREGAAAARRCNEQGDRLLMLCQEAHNAEDGAPQLRREELFERLGLTMSWQDIAAMKRRLGDASDGDAALMRDLRSLSAGGQPSPALQQAEMAQDQQHDVAMGVSGGAVRSFMALRAIASAPPQAQAAALHDLRQTEGIVDQLRRTVESCGVERQRTLAEEDYPQAWAAQERETEAMAELVAIHLERIGYLHSAGAEGSEKPVEEADKALAELKRDAEQGREETKRWIAAIEEDKAAMDRAHKDKEAENDQANDALETERQQARQLLKDNADKQAEVFADIEKLYDRVAELGRERGEVVAAVVGTEREAQARRCAHKQFRAGQAQHLTLLDDLQSRAKEMADNVDAVERAAESMRQTLSDAVSRSQEVIDAALLQEQRAHFKRFGELYATYGDRLYSQERREEELDAQVDAAQWRLSIARDTMDPSGIAACRQHVKQLEDDRSQAREATSLLRRKMDDVAQDAEQTEEALLRAGDPVKSPVQEVRDDIAARAVRLISARREMGTKREAKVDEQQQRAVDLKPPPVPEPPPEPPASPTARVQKTSPLVPRAAASPEPASTPAAAAAFRDASERRRRAYEQRLASLNDPTSPPPARGWSASPAPRGMPGSPPQQAAPAPRPVETPKYSDAPNAEALRRRAEELRRAAEESRRRAMMHRQQAEMLGKQRQSQMQQGTPPPQRSSQTTA